MHLLTTDPLFAWHKLPDSPALIALKFLLGLPSERPLLVPRTGSPDTRQSPTAFIQYHLHEPIRGRPAGPDAAGATSLASPASAAA